MPERYPTHTEIDPDFTAQEAAQWPAPVGGEQSAAEHDFGVPESILTADEFKQWATDKGYEHQQRGTYSNEESFLYIKRGFEAGSVEEAEKGLELARHLTEKGALHPDTQWGAYKHVDEKGGYQIFPVSPKLTAWTIDEQLSGRHRQFSSSLDIEDSYIVRWFQRVDPNYKVGQPIPEGSLLRHLNVYEASHPDNWGWDKDGTEYPVDVETVMLRPHWRDMTQKVPDDIEPDYDDYE